jgi:hypothetical protein
VYLHYQNGTNSVNVTKFLWYNHRVMIEGIWTQILLPIMGVCTQVHNDYASGNSEAARHWWLMPIIFATREAVIRRIMRGSEPAQANISWDSILKKPITHTKKGWQGGSRCRPWVQTPVPQKKNKKKENNEVYHLKERHPLGVGQGITVFHDKYFHTI